MNKRVLITGGAGFIGYHLAKRLILQGQNVVLVDNFFRGERDNDLKKLLVNPNIKLIETDLTEKSGWEKVGTGYEHVYHLVGINGTKLFYEMPHEVLRIGVASTINGLDWFINKNNGGKILYTSSNEAYAGAKEAFGQLPIPTPENVPLVVADPFNPRWSYGAQKLIGELFFIHYSKAYNFRMSIVRPHNFYGPREGYDHVIPEIINRTMNRIDPFPIYGSQDKRSFCFIDDAVEAMQMVMESEKTDGQIYHIGAPYEAKATYLAKSIFSLAGWEPKNIDLHNSPIGSVSRRLPDVSKIRRDIGWSPKTSLEEGLKKTYEWHVSNPKII